MPWHRPAPAFLEALVAQQPQLGPNPPTIVDWVEKDENFIVVLEDGRKLSFRKLDPAERKRDFTANDFNPARLDSDRRASGVKEHVGVETPHRRPKKDSCY